MGVNKTYGKIGNTMVGFDSVDEMLKAQQFYNQQQNQLNELKRSNNIKEAELRGEKYIPSRNQNNSTSLFEGILSLIGIIVFIGIIIWTINIGR